ncbi:hypothetical protein [Streptomyces sp. NPDC048710]|uniref:hypothetical protein n=1 Tax=unclassified Streptomyces TaxID=2593676 RepID=UPI003722D8FE
MHGRTYAPYGHPTALPPSRPRPSGGNPAARGVAAAVLAITALITAANAGPARATDAPPSPPTVQQSQP